MASSQVDAPFGCVLRDHNRRDRCRESNARATQALFQKNLKSLVRGGHLQPCISVSDSNENDSSQNQINKCFERDDGSPSPMSLRHSRVLDRWAALRKGKDMAIEIAQAEVEKRLQSQEAEVLSVPNSAPSSSRTSTSREDSLPRTDSLAEISNLGVGASSLVQIWEKRLNQSNSFKMSCSPNGNATETSRSNSGLSFEIENVHNVPIVSNASNASNASSLEEQHPSRGSEAGDSVDEHYDASPVIEDSFEDSQSDASEREREKVRVADIIKRLTAQSPLPSSSSDDNDHDIHHSSLIAPLSREQRCSGFDQTEQHRGFSQVISSPRIIRGRQAFSDLLMHMERDRHREIDTLVDLRAVSRFSHRGRIQSMLRLKLLQRGMMSVVVPRLQPATSRVKKLSQGSNIMHLREKFSTGVEQGSTTQSDAAIPRSLHRGSANNSSIQTENSSFSNKPSQNTPNREVNIIEQQNTTPVQNPLPHASEDLHEEASPSSKVTWQGTSSVAINALPHAREDLHDEAITRSKVTWQGTSLVARNSLPHASEDLHEEASPSSEVTWQETSLVARNTSLHASENLQEKASPALEVTCQEESQVATDTLLHASEDLHEASPSSEVTWQGTISVDRSLDSQETPDTTTYLVGWDENEIAEQLEDDYEYYGETSYDWINEISRPRSYWEDLRKAWYQEMLDSNSGKREIRQLIERRTVSNFLASDFREKIDRLMTSRLGRQTHPDDSQEGEDEESNQDRMDPLMSFLQQRKRPAASNEEEHVQEQEDQEEEYMTEEEDDDEAGSLISGQYQEASDYFDQCTSSQPSPSQLTTWSYRDNEVGDDSDRAASLSPLRHSLSQPRHSPSPPRHSPSPPQHSPSQSYYQNGQQYSPSQYYHQNHRQHSSAPNHPSIEMELIYDLRGHMEQLYHEMSELRKTVKSCVDMQMTLQQSIKQQVRSGQVGGKRSSSGLPKKGNCCICHEVKVDSLFYRCGHMCTCLKCAHELQWNSGKCPVCRAPIVDVVKAHMDY